MILTIGQQADFIHAGASIKAIPIEVVIAVNGIDSHISVGAIESRGDLEETGKGDRPEKGTDRKRGPEKGT